MFSLLTASISQPPWPPMPTPAIFSLLFGDGWPARPRTEGFKIMNELATPAVVAAVAPMKRRREMDLFCGVPVEFFMTPLVWVFYWCRGNFFVQRCIKSVWEP